MAIIPNSLKLSFYDPSKPGGVITVQEDNANLATSLATQFSMQDIIDTISGGGGPVGGSGTLNTIPVWTAASAIGDSPVTIVDGGPGLKEMILGDGYRMVVNRPAAVTAGDPEYQVQQDGVNKVSMGWDDDGVGHGFLYNWAGDGWRIGANGANPVLEIITTVGSVGVEVTGDLSVTGTFKDSSGDVGVAGQLLSSTLTGTDWINSGISWPFQFDLGTSILIQGSNPATTGASNTAYGVGAGSGLLAAGGNVLIGDSPLNGLALLNDNVVIGSGSTNTYAYGTGLIKSVLIGNNNSYGGKENNIVIGSDNSTQYSTDQICIGFNNRQEGGYCIGLNNDGVGGSSGFLGRDNPHTTGTNESSNTYVIGRDNTHSPNRFMFGRNNDATGNASSGGIETFIIGEGSDIDGDKVMSIGWGNVLVGSFGWNTAGGNEAVVLGTRMSGTLLGPTRAGNTSSVKVLIASGYQDNLGVETKANSVEYHTPTATTSGVYHPALYNSASYADDAAASAAGVGLGELYRNGSIVQIRMV